MVDRLFAEARLAALYDLFCPTGERGDFGFHLPLVMDARSVLDVGCGTGTLLRLAREAGHTGRLSGLDPAAAMLDLARQKDPDVEWMRGQLGPIVFERAFDLIVMTGHAFQVLLGDDELRAALSAVRAALTDTGRFAFETRNPAAREWERWTSDRVVEVVDAEGAIVRCTTQFETPDSDKPETVSFTQTYSSPAWEAPELSRSTLRFLDAEALNGFLSEAGLAVDAQYGDWDRSPVSASSPEIITIASRDTAS